MTINALKQWKPYPNYKDSGVEWLGNIPEHWEQIKIKQLAGNDINMERITMLILDIDKTEQAWRNLKQILFVPQNEYDYQKLVDLLDKLIDEVGENCRDAKDKFLLALSLDSNADYLITGDSDLLIIQEFYHTKIVTYQQFYNSIYDENW